MCCNKKMRIEIIQAVAKIELQKQEIQSYLFHYSTFFVVRFRHYCTTTVSENLSESSTTYNVQFFSESSLVSVFSET